MSKRENESPTPRRIAAGVVCIMMLAGSIAAGYSEAPEIVEIPALRVSEEVLVQPCEAIIEESVEVILDEDPDSIKTKEVIEVEEPVAYKSIEKESTELEAGQTCVQQEGCPGVKKVTKEIIREDGQIIEESVVNQETIVESTPEILLIGVSSCMEPLQTMSVTSPFGQRWGRMHEGVDLGMPEGAVILAAKAGIVTFADYTEGYGNLVKIDHGEGLETYYAHCSRLDVMAGQQVEAGQAIAAVGSTGNSTGPHLHFEVRVGGIAQDPMAWLEENLQ